MSKYAELIARLGKATGPDRECDWAIAYELSNGKIGPYQEEYGKAPQGFEGPDTARAVYVEAIAQRTIYPHYTASLDAAMTLVPEGASFEIDRRITDVGWPCTARVWPDGALTIGPLAFANSPAIALCIAALKARDENETQNK